jgi:hypothetical protein
VFDNDGTPLLGVGLVKRFGWYVVHWIIIVNFLLEIGYSGFKALTLTPDGHAMVLFGMAKSLPFEMMVTRRLYAVETWVAIAGLSIYLAITRIAPALARRSET